MQKKLFQLVVVLIFSLVFSTGCSDQAKPVFDTGSQVSRQDNSGQSNKDVSEDSKPVAPKRYRLAFVGDIMVHEGQIKAAYLPETKSYSFSGYFEEVHEYLASPDLTIGNLETTLSGESKRYSGYPQFNTPESLADELKKAGFDLLTTANNHSYDRWEPGVLSTIENLKARGLGYTGTYVSAEDAEDPQLIEKDGLRSVFLAYTYGTNGLVVPEEKSYLVNRIDLAKIQTDINKARAKGADLVVVGLHFGAEYQRFPGDKEKKLVQAIAESGADIIIGTHPHVLQKIEKLRVSYEGKSKDVLVAYSLGNFVSGYRSRYKDTGMIFYVDLLTLPSGTLKVEGYSYLPVWVHRYQDSGRTQYRVIPVEKGINMYGQEGYFISKQDYNKLKQAWEDTKGLLGKEHLLSIDKTSR